MKPSIFLVLLCLAMSGCTSSNNIDIPTIDPPTTTVETLNFEELTAQEEYIGLSTEEQIEMAIDQISEGGVIQFPAETYQLSTTLNIRKGVTLQGVGVTPDGSGESLEDIAGAGDVETRFILKDKKTIMIYADDVTFRHLIIEGVYQSSGVVGSVSFSGSVYNFQTENVIFDGGSYQLSPRNAMSHGVKCRYTTFSKSRNRAFFINRKDETSYPCLAIEKLERCEFYRCEFSVLDPTVKDTRAISLDAGNNENPNIMDYDGFEIRECYFNDIGVASSKCRNFKIIDCEFYFKDLFDFPIHLEEYSCDILLSGCTFVGDNSAEYVMGAMDDSVVENNKVVGSCCGFVQGRFAEGMVIRNNDISQMENIATSFDADATPKAITLWDSVGSRDITIENNKFYSGATVEVKATAEYEDTILFAGNSGCSEESVVATGGYDWSLQSGGLYRIKHIDTERYLTAQGSNAEVTYSDKEDATTLWRSTKMWPNRYILKNEYFDTYLYIYEDTEGYSNADAARSANITPQTKQFSSSVRLPIWEFTEQKEGGYILGPGGGNHGCISIDATDNKLKCLKESVNRGKKSVTNGESLWSFEQYSE